jgi:arsenate reductase (glutaredoxin)
MITVYGIPNCDTVKAALAWLVAHKVKHQFHDFKTQGIDGQTMDAWIAAVGWEALVNKKGMMWRRLDTSMQLGIRDANSARGLMLAHTSVIKRPVVQWSTGTKAKPEKPAKDNMTVGFDELIWAARIA